MRRQQIDAFKKDLDRRFESRLAEYFSAHPPEKNQPRSQEELKPLVHDGIGKARSHGITREWDIYRFVRIHIKYGAEFETQPRTAWAVEILRRTDLDSTQKMDTLTYRFAVEPG